MLRRLARHLFLSVLKSMNVVTVWTTWLAGPLTQRCTKEAPEGQHKKFSTVKMSVSPRRFRKKVQLSHRDRRGRIGDSRVWPVWHFFRDARRKCDALCFMICSSVACAEPLRTRVCAASSSASASSTVRVMGSMLDLPVVARRPRACEHLASFLWRLPQARLPNSSSKIVRRQQGRSSCFLHGRTVWGPKLQPESITNQTQNQCAAPQGLQLRRHAADLKLEARLGQTVHRHDREARVAHLKVEPCVPAPRCGQDHALLAIVLHGLDLSRGLEAKMRDVPPVARATRDRRTRDDQQEDRKTMRHRRCVRQRGRVSHRRQNLSLQESGTRNLVPEIAAHRDREEVAVKVGRSVVLLPSPCASHRHAAGNHPSCARCGRSRGTSSVSCPWSAGSGHRCR